MFMPQAEAEGLRLLSSRQVVERFPAIGAPACAASGGRLRRRLASTCALSVLDPGGGHGLPLFNHFGWLEACPDPAADLPEWPQWACILSSASRGGCPLLWPLAPDPSLLGSVLPHGVGAGGRDEPALGSQSGAGVPATTWSAGLLLRWNLLYGLLMYAVAVTSDGEIIALHG